MYLHIFTASFGVYLNGKKLLGYIHRSYVCIFLCNIIKIEF